MRLALQLIIVLCNFVEGAEDVHYKHLINICHRIFGHLCIGSYIDEFWVLIPYECAWDRTDQELIRLMADNPNLDCVHGQYRNPAQLIVPSYNFIRQNYRVALIEIEEPFIMLATSVDTIDIPISTNASAKRCNMYEYYYNEERLDFALRSIPVTFTVMDECRRFFSDNFEQIADAVLCGSAKIEVSFLEVVNLSGLSPVICDKQLKGYVIAANHSTIVVMRIAFQTDWINFVLSKPRYIRINKHSDLTPSLSHVKCWLFVLTVFILF
ncbi:hypothetical protein Trydic_g13600 [Trypoxylus dichotomus]